MLEKLAIVVDLAYKNGLLLTLITVRINKRKLSIMTPQEFLQRLKYLISFFLTPPTCSFYLIAEYTKTKSFLFINFYQILRGSL